MTPKVDWSDVQETRACRHKPPCREWHTSDGRILKLCRMSQTHVENALESSNKIYHARRTELEATLNEAGDSLVSTIYGGQMVDMILDVLDDDAAGWFETVKALEADLNRRNSARA